MGYCPSGVYLLLAFWSTFQWIHTSGELYSSVEELTKWPALTSHYLDVLDNLIKLEEDKLMTLKRIHNSMSNVVQVNRGKNTTRMDILANSDGGGKITSNHMNNPIIAFVKLNSLVQILDEVHGLLDDGDIYREDTKGGSDLSDRLRLILIELKNNLPSYEDLVGAGRAILRLQTFYEISADDLVKGSIPHNFIWQPDDTQYNLDDSTSEQDLSIMDAYDCFELGKIAFNDGQYSLAIQWLHKSLVMCPKEVRSDQEQHLIGELMNDILEYMAFSAFKLGKIEYSAELTKAWLIRDPSNDRALENLQYYIDEMNYKNQDKCPSQESDEVVTEKDDIEFLTELDRYSISEDESVRRLCHHSGMTHTTSLKCYIEPRSRHEFHFYQTLKLEVLSLDPKIIRIHDVISKMEAQHLRNLALPKLKRSTVSYESTTRTSEFRIAKTAWLDSDEDARLREVEQRLSDITGLDLSDSEDLQVVNYGLGGFYGPHLDSTRPTSSDQNNSSTAISNDRLATILIYLNRIDAGGSTVFPRLNITITPIERSSVIWFNILEGGYSDERTLHIGCPILMGSKWIATKWPRELPNKHRRLRSFG